MHENPRVALKPGQHLETRYMLAGAYAGRGRRGLRDDDRVTRSHSVVVEGDSDVRLLCGGNLDSIADPYSASPSDRELPPTCPRCLERWERLRHHTPNADHSRHPTVVEYAVQEMFKRKSIKTAAASTAAKLNGHSNMFIDPSGALVEIDTRSLESALWDRLAESAIRSLKSYKAGKEDWAVDGTLQYFKQSPKLKAQLKARIVDALGHDPFAGHTPNYSENHYVWILGSRGEPLDEGPYGPYSLGAAKQFARIGATEGEHDRAVSFGPSPTASEFRVLKRYRGGSGHEVA